MSQYYKVTAYASVPQRHEVEVTLPLAGPQGPTGPQGPAGASTGDVLTTAGDLLYRGASAADRLGIGTTGQVLKVSGGLPVWAAEAGGGVTSVTGTAPIVSSGGTTPAISISAATTSAAGSMSSADKAKLDAGNFTTLSASNDMEITDNTRGVILKSPNNTRYRLTVSNSGLPIFTALLLLLLAQLAPAQNVGMATDTNGTILTDRTNTLTFTNPLTWATNVVAATRTNLGLGSLATNNSVPSGAATTNSILTADGAGGSSFVASRVQKVTLTENFAVTNSADLNATNGNVPDMSVNLDANSLYVARWHVLLTCGAEGARLEAVVGAGTNGIPGQSVAGRLGRPSFSYGDTYFLISGARQCMSLVGFSGAGFNSAVTNGVFNGSAQFRTGISNTTLFWRFNQNTSSNVATTLLSNSIFYVEKLSP